MNMCKNIHKSIASSLAAAALLLGSAGCNDFLNVVDEVLEEHELEGVIQVAPFHPAFQFEDTEPDDASAPESSADSVSPLGNASPEASSPEISS